MSLYSVHCLTQSVTGLVLPGADVQSSEEDSMVMPFTTFPHQTRLPLTETVEGLVGMVIDGQTQLEMERREIKIC